MWKMLYRSNFICCLTEDELKKNTVVLVLDQKYISLPLALSWKHVLAKALFRLRR